MEEFFVGVSAFDFATGGTGGLQPQKCLTQGCGVVHHFFSLVFLLFSWFLPLGYDDDDEESSFPVSAYTSDSSILYLDHFRRQC